MMSELQELANEIRACHQCRLAQGRKLAVPGSGPDHAEILFVGEAPGFHEDQQGLPFVGASGNLLNQLLAKINLSRKDVFIANVIKCRPPDNRDPQPDELMACRPYLDRLVALLEPKIVVTLGRFSMQLAYTGASITRIHGQPKKVDGIVYLPMFHPAAALRQANYRTLIEQDFAKIPQLLADLRAVEEVQQAPPPPEQLSLF
jgi:DNA polymerase